MQNNLLNLKNQALALIKDTDNKKDLENIRVKYLGRKGQINQILKELPSLDPDKKARLGRTANDLKKAIEQTIKSKLNSLSSKPSTSWLDLTAPGKSVSLGHLHPITLAIKEITEII